jgi:hypothetical protein
MNRIVREHYPVAKLPEDLREGLDPSAEVIVTVEEVERPDKIMTLEEIFASREPPYLSKVEIDRRLREQRDAWDD